MRPLVTVTRRVIIAVLITLLCFWILSATAVLVWSARDQARPAAAVVVLGAAQYAGRPSPVLRARLDHGIEVWRRNPTALLVLTGGTGSGDTTSEAEVGRSYVRKLGVPDSMIVVENSGRTTSESMRAVAEILRERRADSAVLVSDPFHMFRLWIVAKRLGIIPYTSPTQTSPISPNSGEKWRYIVSESIKAPAAFLFERPLSAR